jgi:hypothetical protein
MKWDNCLNINHGGHGGPSKIINEPENKSIIKKLIIKICASWRKSKLAKVSNHY